MAARNAVRSCSPLTPALPLAVYVCPRCSTVCVAVDWCSGGEAGDPQSQAAAAYPGEPPHANADPISFYISHPFHDRSADCNL